MAKIEDFRKPLGSKEIQWKIQTKVKKGKFTVVPYIDARAARDRLDSIFGVADWETDYQCYQTGVLCKLSINIDDKKVTKSEGSDYTTIEGFKGGISGAFKRACTAYGLGRELYDYPMIQIKSDKSDGQNDYISDKALERLHALTKAFNEGKVTKKYYLID